MNDRVIYTCITGGYDILPKPQKIYDGYDYICFTDEVKGDRQGIWQICSIPFRCDDKIRLSRFVKLMPHEVLSNYKYSVYIDSNILILDDLLYECVENMIKDNTMISLSKHPENRKDIYEEAIYVMKFRCAKFKDVKEQIKFLRRDGYPEGTGMYENNVIYRQHNDCSVIKIDEMWWKMFMRFTKRDQLSLVYVFWKLNVWPPYLLPGGSKINVLGDRKDALESQHLRRIPHRNRVQKNIPFVLKCWNFFVYMTYEQFRFGVFKAYFQYFTRIFRYSKNAN